ELRDSGVIGQLGASLYTPVEALEAARDPDIACIQIPFNLLDWRWRDAGLQQALRVRTDLVVHARSALLQGILAGGVECWPNIAGLRAQDIIDQLDSLVVQLNRQDRADLCLAYVRAHTWITSTVVGVETQRQLLRNIDLFQQPMLTQDECARVEKTLVNLPEDLLNPSRWPLIQTRRAAS
ncbi:MAG: aldo/keto reductase, partial [Gammaproteobacteria bacterium]|nr:aldo/keto reductase [Gammaproteobacteria bacterium]